MKNLITSFRWKMLAGIFSAFLMTVLFLLSRPIDQDMVDGIVDSFLRIKHAEASIDRGVLQLRYYMLYSYDTLDEQFYIIREEIRTLRDNEEMMSVISGTSIETSIKNYEYLLSERLLLVNRFKMQDVVLKNSLLHISKFRKKYIYNRIGDVDILIEAILANIFQYNLAYDEKLSEEILKDVLELESNTADREGEHARLKQFILNVRKAVAAKKELNFILEKLLERGADRNIDPILVDFKNHYNTSNYYINIFRLLLYAFSVMMFLYAGFMMLKLFLARRRLHESNLSLVNMNAVFVKFVPVEFLQMLGKENISQVTFGDYVKRDMSVLFSDIRSFTSMSEMMTPEENFEFINTYLGKMGPVIRKHNGYIDKYIGDAVMALFSGTVDDTVAAAVEMIGTLEKMHSEHIFKHPFHIGIGIHYGSMMLGTIGEHDRMEGTVISDAVNLASRVENLTKKYKVNLLITEDVYERLKDSSKENIRFIDYVKVKGKSNAVRLYEVFENDPTDIKQLKKFGKHFTDKAVDLLCSGSPEESLKYLDTYLKSFPEDPVMLLHRKACRPDYEPVSV